MQFSKEAEEFQLSMKTITWQKDSHSLFDYEFNKNVVQNTFEFSLANKYVYIFRNNSSKHTPKQPAKSASRKATNSNPYKSPTGNCLGVFR